MDCENTLCNVEFDGINYSVIFLGETHNFCCETCRKKWLQQQYEAWEEAENNKAVRRPYVC